MKKLMSLSTGKLKQGCKVNNEIEAGKKRSSTKKRETKLCPPLDLQKNYLGSKDVAETEEHVIEK